MTLARSGEAVRMTTIFMTELHYALLDFLVYRSGGTRLTNRSDMIRWAVEPFVVGHDLWDPEYFRKYAHEKATTIKTKKVREKFLEDVEEFLTHRNKGSETYTLPEASEMDIGTTAAVFKFGE